MLLSLTSKLTSTRASRVLSLCTVATCLLLLGACGQYDISLNERPVYGPHTLLKPEGIVDPALASCLNQHIADARIRSPDALTTLNCSSAGIDRLDGLQVFTELKHLKLSSNTLRNLWPLTKLMKLASLQLDDNRIVDPVPLARLKHLTTLDLRGNTALQCGSLPLSVRRVDNLLLPLHCQETL